MRTPRSFRVCGTSEWDDISVSKCPAAHGRLKPNRVIYVPRVASPELIGRNGSSRRADATTRRPRYEAREPKLDDGMISELDVSMSIRHIRYVSFVDPLSGGGVGRLLLIGLQLAHAVGVNE